FFSSRRRHTRSTRDWSSDVCSSDLYPGPARGAGVALCRVPGGRFLADQDVANPFEVVQDVVDRQHGAAGKAEDDVHALTLQTLRSEERRVGKEYRCGK